MTSPSAFNAVTGKLSIENYTSTMSTYDSTLPGINMCSFM